LSLSSLISEKITKMARTPSCDKSGMRKGTWTAEEDRKLIAYVTRYGCWNWRQLPKFAGKYRTLLAIGHWTWIMILDKI